MFQVLWKYLYTGSVKCSSELSSQSTSMTSVFIDIFKHVWNNEKHFQTSVNQFYNRALSFKNIFFFNCDTLKLCFYYMIIIQVKKFRKNDKRTVS